MKRNLKCLLVVLMLSVSMVILTDMVFGLRKIPSLKTEKYATVFSNDYIMSKRRVSTPFDQIEPCSNGLISLYSVREFFYGLSKSEFGQNSSLFAFHDLIFYEDNKCLYFVSKKQSSVLSYYSLYAKIAGGCIRKDDGFMLVRGTQIWIPSGCVPYTSKELQKQAEEWKTIEETDLHIGLGVARTHHYGITNNVHIGIIQQRIYLARDGKVNLFFKEGMILTDKDYDAEVKIELYPIFEWFEGPAYFTGKIAQ